MAVVAALLLLIQLLAEVEAESGSTATLMDEEDYDALVEREQMAAADKANAAYP